MPKSNRPPFDSDLESGIWDRSPRALCGLTRVAVEAYACIPEHDRMLLGIKRDADIQRDLSFSLIRGQGANLPVKLSTPEEPLRAPLSLFKGTPFAFLFLRYLCKRQGFLSFKIENLSKIRA